MTLRAPNRLVAGGLLLWCCAILLVPAPEAQAQEWNHLTPRERYDTMQKYREYENLPKDRKKDVDKRYEQWRSMPDAKRERVLRNYERYQKMPPSERRQFDRKYDRWRQDAGPRRERRGADRGNTERDSDRRKKKDKKQR
jgi:hypothetical protein